MEQCFTSSGSRGMFKYLYQRLSKLIDKPHLKSNRTINLTQFFAAKFLTSEAIQFLKVLGFKEDGDKLRIAPNMATSSLVIGSLPFLTQKLHECELQEYELQDSELQDCKHTSPQAESINSVQQVGNSGSRKRCKNDCGFYGSLQFNDYCSSCFQEQKKVKHLYYRKKWHVLFHILSSTRFLVRTMQRKQHETKRCWQCTRKVRTFGIECKCGYVFCGQHRYPTSHDCTWDHRKFHRHYITQQNPKMVKRKVPKL